MITKDGEMVNDLLSYWIKAFKEWPGHDTHFHTSFIDWLNCPQTCLEEVQEFFSKL